MRNIICLLAIVTLTGCELASGTAIVTGEKRSPVVAESVQLILEPPKTSYEVVGIVSASSESGWTEQESLDYAIAELKNQAAKIGANAILFGSAGEAAGSAYGTFIPNGYGGGTYVGGTGSAQVVSGKAIFIGE